jgi:tRNA-binding protein
MGFGPLEMEIVPCTKKHMSVDIEPDRNLSWEDFQKVQMVVGTIINAEIFEEVRNPAYKMIIDFGDLGKRKTSAQITQLYTPEDLIGKQVVAVVNFPPKQIANIMSECLVLGGIGDNKEVTLIQPERNVKNGTRIG